jgi:ribosomal protein L7/L12
LPGATDLADEAAASGGLEAEIVRIANEQGLITAIKHYREATGAGLADAKAAVEALIAGAPAGGESPNENEILALVRERGKIAAIKRHRELTGSGLKEAKEAVEGMMARTGTQPGKSTAGCGSYVLALVLFGVGIGLVCGWGF